MEKLIMDHEDQKHITLEDGSVYAVEVIHTSNGSKISALVEDEAMRSLAFVLLPSAQKLSEARAMRADFYRKSELGMGIQGGRVSAQAQEAARIAKQHALAVYAVAGGSNHLPESELVVTVDLWREILGAFHQDVGVGSLKMEG